MSSPIFPTSPTPVTAPPPPAPLQPGPPPSLSPGGRTALRATLVIVASVLVAASAVSLGVAAATVSAVRVIADDAVLPSAMRSLVIDTGDIPAAIRITTDRDATEPRAQLRLVKSARVGDHALTVTPDGTSARLTVDGAASEFLRWGRAGELTVTLPPDVSRRLSVTTQQQDGVLFAQADLDELIARSADGAVVLSGAARRIDVQLQDGAIVTREPISVTESFIAKTVDGDVTVDFRDAAPRTVDLLSNDGDVAVALPPAGPYLVRASSGATTSVRVPETSDPERAVAEVTANSGDGTVTVRTLDGNGFPRHR